MPTRKTSKKQLQYLAAGIVKRSGISRQTVEALLPHVFDEIRCQLAEGSYPCVVIESFGTFTWVQVPERERRYTYGGRDEIRTLPPKKKIKFAPTRNLQREIDNHQFDPTRRSFVHHAGDPTIRYRSNMCYDRRKKVYLEPIEKQAD